MYTEEARKRLEAKRDAANRALNEMNPFAIQMAQGRITDETVKKSVMDSIKANALLAGIDISAWDGTPAPAE